jgi:dolichol-phosphate mannosyltransferase
VTSVAFPYEPSAEPSAVEHAELHVRPTPSLEIPGPIVFVVPAYNEAENLPRLLDDLESSPSLFSPESRLIVVDDGSHDGTPELVRQYRGPLPVELVELGENQGPGAAFRAGFAAALASCPENALLVTLEADTTSDLEALPAMLARAAAGAELVLASVHSGGRMVNISPLRRVLSAGAGFVVRHTLGVDARTVSCFFRVYRASILRAALARHGDDLIRESGFACKAELLAKIASLGARIEEVPVDLDGDRRNGQSRMRIMPTLLGYGRLMARQRLRKESAPA